MKTPVLQRTVRFSVLATLLGAMLGGVPGSLVFGSAATPGSALPRVVTPTTAARSSGSFSGALLAGNTLAPALETAGNPPHPQDGKATHKAKPFLATAVNFRLVGNGTGSRTQWWGLGGLALTVPFLLWLIVRRKGVNAINLPGFEVITPSEKRVFIPLEEKFQHMDFLNSIATQGSLRLSANLNKVNLSHRRFGYLLEDKNYRNALLVNRRRVRRTLLRDGDVLDMGDLTLLYRDSRNPALVRRGAAAPSEGKVQINFDRVRGPVRQGTPMLTPENQPNRTYYVTKNIVFLGRSETNDIVIKSQKVNFRHAKIERVGSHYKLIDLGHSSSTFVNSRRVEQRVLREGDEIAIENHRFKFQIAAKPVREHAQGAPSRYRSEGPNEAPEASGQDSSPQDSEENGE